MLHTDKLYLIKSASILDEYKDSYIGPWDTGKVVKEDVKFTLAQMLTRQGYKDLVTPAIIDNPAHTFQKYQDALEKINKNNYLNRSELNVKNQWDTLLNNANAAATKHKANPIDFLQDHKLTNELKENPLKDRKQFFFQGGKGLSTASTDVANYLQTSKTPHLAPKNLYKHLSLFGGAGVPLLFGNTDSDLKMAGALTGTAFTIPSFIQEINAANKARNLLPLNDKGRRSFKPYSQLPAQLGYSVLSPLMYHLYRKSREGYEIQ